jgi:HD superfamily phosphodiesterase
MDIVEEIRKYVESESHKDTNMFGINAYDGHFVGVVKYSKLLAEQTGADIEIVELAAWLHDIGSIHGDPENHHIIGPKIAEEILKRYDYPQDRIERVKHCILAHRGSKDIPRETIEAECVADGDAMSHFENIHSLFYLALVARKIEPFAARNFVRDKLQRSWGKLTPRAKELIRPKYDAAMLLLE